MCEVVGFGENIVKYSSISVHGFHSLLDIYSTTIGVVQSIKINQNTVSDGELLYVCMSSNKCNPLILKFQTIKYSFTNLSFGKYAIMLLSMLMSIYEVFQWYSF